MCLRENPVSREAEPELRPPCFHPLAGGAEGNSQASLGSGQGEWSGRSRPRPLATSIAHLGCASQSPAPKWPLGLQDCFLKLLPAQRNQSLSHFIHLRKILCANLKSMGEREPRKKRKMETVFYSFIEKSWVALSLYSFSLFLSPLSSDVFSPFLSSLSTTQAARCILLFHP